MDPDKSYAIRQAIKALLEAVAAIQATVYDTNTTPLDSGELPIINIFTLNDAEATQSRAYHPVHNRLKTGEVEIHVVLHADTTELSKKISILKKQVQDTILASRSLDGVVTAIDYDSTQYDYSGVRTELPHVMAVMKFNVEFKE